MAIEIPKRALLSALFLEIKIKGKKWQIWKGYEKEEGGPWCTKCGEEHRKLFVTEFQKPFEKLGSKNFVCKNCMIKARFFTKEEFKDFKERLAVKKTIKSLEEL